MTDVKPKLVLNDVLCYIYSSLDDNKDTESIIKTCQSFFTEAQIKDAKTTLCSFNNEKYNQRRGENSVKSHLIDIISLIRKFTEDNVEIPLFVARAYNSMPPGSESDYVSGSISVLIDEIIYLKEEIKCLKESNSRNDLCLDNISIKSDLIEIKNQLKNFSQDAFRNEARRRLSYTPALRNYHSQSGVDISSHNKSILGFEEVKNDEVTSHSPFDSNLFEHLNFINDGDSIGAINCEPSAPTLSQFSTQPDFEMNDDFEFSDPAKSAETVTYANKAKTNPKTITLKSNDSIEKNHVKSQPKIVVNSSNYGTYKPTLRKDSDGYLTVYSRSKMKNKTEGTRESNNDSLKCAKKMVDLYIGRCDVDIQPKTVIEYVKNELKIEVIECSELDTRVRFSKAFKLTVELSDRSKLLDLESWPKGIIVRKFYNRR